MVETVAIYSDGSAKTLTGNHVVVFDPDSFTSISVGMFHMAGLRPDGTVTAVILNNFEGVDIGQCDVSSWTDIVEVSAGFSHTVGLRPNGTVVAVAIPEENTVTTVPDQYKGTEFESFLSPLKYPAGPFLFSRSYSTVQVESMSIIEIEKSGSRDRCVNNPFEVIGTVRGSDMISLDVDCFDADGYNIYSTALAFAPAAPSQCGPLLVLRLCTAYV